MRTRGRRRLRYATAIARSEDTLHLSVRLHIDASIRRHTGRHRLLRRTIAAHIIRHHTAPAATLTLMVIMVMFMFMLKTHHTHTHRTSQPPAAAPWRRALARAIAKPVHSHWQIATHRCRVSPTPPSLPASQPLACASLQAPLPPTAGAGASAPSPVAAWARAGGRPCAPT